MVWRKLCVIEPWDYSDFKSGIGCKNQGDQMATLVKQF